MKSRRAKAAEKGAWVLRCLALSPHQRIRRCAALGHSCGLLQPSRRQLHPPPPGSPMRLQGPPHHRASHCNCACRGLSHAVGMSQLLDSSPEIKAIIEKGELVPDQVRAARLAGASLLSCWRHAGATLVALCPRGRQRCTGRRAARGTLARRFSLFLSAAGTGRAAGGGAQPGNQRRRGAGHRWLPAHRDPGDPAAGPPCAAQGMLRRRATAMCAADPCPPLLSSLQVDFVKLFYDKLTALSLKHADTPGVCPPSC